MSRRAKDADAWLALLWAVWWLHRGHGEDSYAVGLMLEWGGRSGLRRFQRLARQESYEFRRGFWAEAMKGAKD